MCRVLRTRGERPLAQSIGYRCDRRLQPHGTVAPRLGHHVVSSPHPSRMAEAMNIHKFFSINEFRDMCGTYVRKSHITTWVAPG